MFPFAVVAKGKIFKQFDNFKIVLSPKWESEWIPSQVNSSPPRFRWLGTRSGEASWRSSTQDRSLTWTGRTGGIWERARTVDIKIKSYNPIKQLRLWILREIDKTFALKRRLVRTSIQYHKYSLFFEYFGYLGKLLMF